MSTRFNKFSLALCAIILVVGLPIAWQDSRDIVLARARQVKLPDAAKLAGISVDDSSSEASARRSKRDRPDSEPDLDQLLADMKSAQKQWSGESGKDPIPEEMIQLQGYTDRCGRLSPQQMKTFMGIIHDLPDLGEQDRGVILLMSLLAFSEKRPADTLALAQLDPAIMDSGSVGQIITNSLKVWAKDDLPAAVQWAKANPDKIKDGVRMMLIEQAMDQDQPQGLKILTELKMDASNRAWSSLLYRAKPDASPAVLVAIRQSISQLPDEKSRQSASGEIFSNVAETLTRGGYEATRQWLDSTRLTQPELETVAKADPEVAKQWALTLPPGPEREETLQRTHAK